MRAVALIETKEEEHLLMVKIMNFIGDYSIEGAGGES